MKWANPNDVENTLQAFWNVYQLKYFIFVARCVTQQWKVISLVVSDSFFSTFEITYFLITLK